MRGVGRHEILPRLFNGTGTGEPSADELRRVEDRELEEGGVEELAENRRVGENRRVFMN